MLRFAVEFGAHQIQAVTLQLNASPTSAIERKSDVVRSLYCTALYSFFENKMVSGIQNKRARGFIGSIDAAVRRTIVKAQLNSRRRLRIRIFASCAAKFYSHARSNPVQGVRPRSPQCHIFRLWTHNRSHICSLGWSMPRKGLVSQTASRSPGPVLGGTSGDQTL